MASGEVGWLGAWALNICAPVGTLKRRVILLGRVLKGICLIEAFEGLLSSGFVDED